MTNTPDQVSRKAGLHTFASGGADKSTGTNSPIYGPRNSGILAAIPFFRTRRALGTGRKVIAEYFDARDSLSVPYSNSLLRIPPLGRAIAAGGNVSPTFPPAFHQFRQDNRTDVSQTLPIKIVVHGRRIALRVSAVRTEVQGPLSFVFLRTLWFLVAHESNRIQGVLSWVTNVLSRTTK